MQVDKNKIDNEFEGYKLCSSRSPLLLEDGTTTITLDSPPLTRLQPTNLPLSLKQSKYRFDFNYLFNFNDEIFFVNEQLHVQRLLNDSFQTVYDLSHLNKHEQKSTLAIDEEPSLYLMEDRTMIVSDGFGHLQVVAFDQECSNPKSVLEETFTLDMHVQDKESQATIQNMPFIILSAKRVDDSIHVVVESTFDYSRINTDNKKRRVDFWISILIFKSGKLESRYDLESNNPIKDAYFSEDTIILISESQLYIKGQEIFTEQVKTISIPIDAEPIDIDDRLSAYTTEEDFEMDENASCYCVSSFNRNRTPMIVTETSSEVKPLLLVQKNLIGVQHDVHLCVFSIQQGTYHHDLTFNAISYILKGKKEKRYLVIDEEIKMCVIAEHQTRLYVYDGNTIKMNKAEHQLVDIGNESIMGVRIVNGKVVVLSDKHLRLFTINPEKIVGK